MKQSFQKSAMRNITAAFAIASNIGIGVMIWHSWPSADDAAFTQHDVIDNSSAIADQGLSDSRPSPRPTLTADLKRDPPQLKDATLATPTPVTIALNDDMALTFEDRADFYALQDGIINHPFYDEAYDRYHEKPPALHAAFMALGQITPLPYQAYEAAAWKETRLRPHQVNPSSGAAGYFQFKPETFYEAVYFMGERFPAVNNIVSLIESSAATASNNYVISYEPINNDAKNTLANLVHDPLISGLAYYSYLDHYMQNYVQVKLPDLVPNQTDYYLISFRGPGGAAAFLEALEETPDAPAHDMFISGRHPEGHTHPFVEQNKSVYYDRDTQEYRSYQQVYDYIADTMGIGRAVVDPQAVADAHLVALSDTNTDFGTIISNDSVLFAGAIPRPQARPDYMNNDSVLAENIMPNP